MGNWSEQQDTKKEIKRRDDSRKETIAKYFLDLSKLVFAGIVIGEIISLQGDLMNSLSWYILMMGVLSTCLFAWIGNKILKN